MMRIVLIFIEDNLEKEDNLNRLREFQKQSFGRMTEGEIVESVENSTLKGGTGPDHFPHFKKKIIIITHYIDIIFSHVC